MCVCDITWGWYSAPTTSSSMYEPSTNKDQKNTKAWVQYIFLYFLFFFKDVSLCFSKIWLLLCSQTKTLLVNWLGTLNFSGFWCNSMWKVQYSRSHWKIYKRVFLSLFSPVSDPGPSAIEQVQRGLLTFSNGGLLLLRKRGDACVTAPAVCSLSGI